MSPTKIKKLRSSGLPSKERSPTDGLHCVAKADQIATVGVSDKVLKTMKQHLKTPIRSFETVYDIEETSLRFGATCIVVNADVFDATAAEHTAYLKRATQDHVDTSILAISSFLPTAYRQLITMHGADDCTLEAAFIHQLTSGKLVTQRTNIISFQKNQEPEKATSWENSFPAGTVSGTGWIIDVLSDLAAFARSADLSDVCGVLTQTQAEVAYLITDDDPE